MRHRSHSGRTQKRRTSTSEDAERQDKMPIEATFGQQQDPGNIAPRSRNQDASRTVPVEQRPDLRAEHQPEEREGAGDPADGGSRVIGQLVLGEIVLQDTGGIHHAIRRHEQEERAHDNQPRARATVRRRLVRDRDMRGDAADLGRRLDDGEGRVRRGFFVAGRGVQACRA